MEKWGSILAPVIVVVFTYLTAKATLSTKRVDYSTTMNKQSFDIIVSRLEEAEKKLENFSNLQTSYDILKKDYDELTTENAKISQRLEELEGKKNEIKWDRRFSSSNYRYCMCSNPLYCNDINPHQK